jgi:hypothetical protein
MFKLAILSARYVAENVTRVDDCTACVLIITFAVVAPAGILMLAGICATAGLPLFNITKAPPVGAGAVNVIVTKALLPPL